MARYSFAVFFIHGYILTYMMELKKRYEIVYQSNLLELMLIAFVVTMVSAIIAHTIKKMIPKYSRMIIGA
jgi:peptidoglycan/LPS O-acetylase OafA/YrhL